jgi:hypothetical protein
MTVANDGDDFAVAGKLKLREDLARHGRLLA